MATFRPDETIKDPAGLGKDRNSSQSFQETATDYAFDPLALRRGDPLGKLAGKNYFAANEGMAASDANARALGESQYRSGLGRYDDLTMSQDELAQMLAARASGQMPSVSEMQTRQAIADAAANTRAQAAGARGINRVSAQRQAMATSADLSGRAAEMGAIQRLQEQQAATQALQQQQGLQAQTFNNAQNQSVTLQELGQRGQISADELRQRTSEGNAQRKGELQGGLLQGAGSVLSMISDIRAKENIIPVGAGTSNARIRDLLEDEPGTSERSGPSAEMLALVAGNRSERDRELHPARNAIGLTAEQQAAMARRRSQYQGRELARPLIEAWRSPEMDEATKIALLANPDGSRRALDPVDPIVFQYKPDAADRMGTDTDPRPGISAQDLQKSPMLSDLVEETPDGKAIDGPKALSASLALLAGMDKRLKKMEGKRAA